MEQTGGLCLVFSVHLLTTSHTPIFVERHIRRCTIHLAGCITQPVQLWSTFHANRLYRLVQFREVRCLLLEY